MDDEKNKIKIKRWRRRRRRRKRLLEISKWLEFSSPILMSSIEKLIKYVIGVERYAMQNWKYLGHKIKLHK